MYALFLSLLQQCVEFLEPPVFDKALSSLRCTISEPITLEQLAPWNVWKEKMDRVIYMHTIIHRIILEFI